MRYLIALVILVAFNSIGFTQIDSLNQIDNKGLKQGVWKKNYDNDKVRYRGEFKNDSPIGTFIYYTYNGKLSHKVDHTGSISNTTFYHLNGKLMGTGQYINQKREGEWKYYDNKQILSKKENYIKDKLQGKSSIYYVNGRPSKVMTYVDGLIQGEVKEYFATGGLKFTGKYIDGNPDSLVTYYHPSSNRRIEGKYQDAVKHGKWTYYDELGKIKAHEFYNLGIVTKHILIENGKAVEQSIGFDEK